MRIPTLVFLITSLITFTGAYGASNSDDSAKSCCKGPTVVKFEEPKIPEDFLTKGETAEIVVRCAINEKGELIGAKTVKSTREDLEKIVMAALEKWEFDPSTHMGEPQRATLNIPFRFTVAAK